MPTRAERLQAAAEREARLIDTITKRFAEELGSVLRLMNRHVRTLIQRFDAEDRRLVSTAANLGRAIRLRADLTELLRASGFHAVVKAAVDAPLDRLAETVMQGSRTAAQAAALTPFDINALAAFKELRLAELLALGEDATRVLWRTTLDGVLGLRPIADLVADLEDALDVTEREARTLYDTAISTYSRQVEHLHSTGDPDELFLYAGPLDKKTREFCVERVGKVFSRAEIEEMDNGQIGDVLTTGGGYNCRHTWKRVSLLDEELLDLHKSGGRLEHVEAQLVEVG